MMADLSERSNSKIITKRYFGNFYDLFSVLFAIDVGYTFREIRFSGDILVIFARQNFDKPTRNDLDEIFDSMTPRREIRAIKFSRINVPTNVES